jgi:hypothetical protein
MKYVCIQCCTEYKDNPLFCEFCGNWKIHKQPNKTVKTNKTVNIILKKQNVGNDLKNKERVNNER